MAFRVLVGFGDIEDFKAVYVHNGARAVEFVKTGFDGTFSHISDLFGHEYSYLEHEEFDSWVGHYTIPSNCYCCTYTQHQSNCEATEESRRNARPSDDCTCLPREDVYSSYWTQEDLSDAILSDAIEAVYLVGRDGVFRDYYKEGDDWYVRYARRYIAADGKDSRGREWSLTEA